MDSQYFKVMVTTLTEALELSPEQARTAHEALAAAWHNKIALVWTAEQVIHLGEAHFDRRLTADEARNVLDYLRENYEASAGVSDETVVATIEGLGLSTPPLE